MSPTTDESARPARRVLVTGASRGIGAAVARRFAAQGAHVVVTGRHPETVELLAREIRDDGGRAVGIPADLTDRGSLTALMDQVGSEAGGLDVLVNNAGAFPVATRAVRVGWEEWDTMLALHLSAPWYLACRAKELMGEGGVVVNNASTAAYYPSTGLVAYNVSKSALLMLTKVLALEWANDGVRVVGIAPGKVDTDLVGPVLAWVEKRGRSLNPLGRVGLDDEVADLVEFLASPRAGYITGITVPVDGGELLEPGG